MKPDTLKPVDVPTKDVAVGDSSHILELTDAERAIEVRLRRRIDFVVMPLVVLIFLLNYIDRTNYVAARLQGLQKDLHLTDTDYQVGLSIFFVGYIVNQIPSNFLLNYFARPSWYLGTCVLVWGLVTTCTSQVKSYGGLIACRLLLGFVEAPFVPGVMFYLSKWYTRRELNFRQGIFYSGSLLSGAFGNLIAAGILSGLSGRRGLAAWQWLYIIEGSITMTVGIAVVLLLPDFPNTWSRLTPEQRIVATRRLLIDAAETDVDDGDGQHSARTQFRGVVLALSDPKTYLMSAMHVCMIGTISFQNFFPTLTGTLGYNHLTTLLLAAPPYVFATVASWVHSYYADRSGGRFWFYVYPIPISIVGFALFMSVESFGPRYLALFLVAISFNMFGTFYSWISSSIPRPPAKRAAAMAFINGWGNSSSIWTTFLYTTSSAPFYRPAFGTCLALQVVAFALAIVLRAILMRQNRELERTGGDAGRQELSAEVEAVDIEAVKSLRKNYRYQV